MEFSTLTKSFLDFLLPPRCLGCGDQVQDQNGICHDCFPGLSFISAPMCQKCGLPQDNLEEDQLICASCSSKPPVFERARSALRYDDLSRKLILSFKHSDETHGATIYAKWMLRACHDMLSNQIIFVPIPLHRRRLWMRRYNQAALLASAMAAQTNNRCEPDLLHRIRATPSQGHLKKGQRHKNVRGAFAVNPSKLDVVGGSHIILIDDVMTSGATIGEAAQTLRKAGAQCVDVATLARVILPDKE